MKNFFGKIVSFFKNEKNSIIKPTVVLLCICIIIPLALAVTNKITVPKIAELEKQAAQEALAELVPEADKFEEQTVNGVTFNIAQKQDENLAYVFTAKASGYGGKDSVTVMTAVGSDGKVLNLKVLDVSSETPGLGQNAGKLSWYKQFIGLSGEIALNDINTVTSATITSKAVMSAVNEALNNFSKVANQPNADIGVMAPEDSFAIPDAPSDNPDETEVVTDEK